MKSKILPFFTSMACAAILLTSCQKESNLEQANTYGISAEASITARNESSCRLTSVVGPGLVYNYAYNQAGLCSTMDISDYGIFRHEYDRNGRLTKARLFVGDELVFTIVFFHNNRGLTMHEIWYYGDTQDIYDEVFHTRNAQGNIVRMESFVNDYYSVANFSHEGNLTDWKFYMSGILAMSDELQFRTEYKNFYKAVPGIEYGYPFANPFSYESKCTPASEKLVVYDYEGNPTPIIDHDPNMTIPEPGFQNYLAANNLFDRVSNEWQRFDFSFENCGPEAANKSSNSYATSSFNNGKQSILSQLFQRKPGVNFKEYLKQQHKMLLKSIKH